MVYERKLILLLAALTVADVGLSVVSSPSRERKHGRRPAFFYSSSDILVFKENVCLSECLFVCVNKPKSGSGV